MPSTVEDVLLLLENERARGGDGRIAFAPAAAALARLRDALADGLGFGENLENTSIECLCSPGRFALNLMLRELMLPAGIRSGGDGSSSPEAIGSGDHQRIIDRFLDASFAALKDQPR